MANPVKGETPLVLADGREFTLVLDMEAMLSVEDTMGKPLPKVMAMAAEGFMTATAAIAQSAFALHHPEVGRADVLKMMQSDNVALTEALSKASDAAFGSGEPGNAEAPKAKPRRGKTSGRSGAKPG